MEEAAEEYITALFHLIDLYNYLCGSLKDKMLWDRLVVGIRDRGLSQRLQMDSELTLANAMKLVRQSEAVKKHTSQLKGHEPSTQPLVDLATMYRRPTQQHSQTSTTNDSISARLSLASGGN